MRRNSDEMIRALSRRAGDGDLEAARRLVVELERRHGTGPTTLPPTLEEWAKGTADVVLRGGGREFTDEEFERWRTRDTGRTIEVGRAIDATVNVAIENVAAAYSRFVAERIVLDMDPNDVVFGLDHRLVDRIQSHLVRSVTGALRDDYLGWSQRFHRRVREILRSGS